MSDLITKLQELVEPFEYGKLDLLDRLDDLEFEFVPDGVIIHNWYDFSEGNFHGDCGELVAKAYKAVRTQFPDLSVSVDWGYDVEFFDPFVGIHAFLRARNGVSDDLLVDPGLRKVIPYSESGYIVEYDEPPESVEDRMTKRHVDLREGGTMLGIDQKTGLVFYLGANPRHSQSGQFHTQGGDDVFYLTTYRKFNDTESLDMLSSIGMPPVDKRNWPISPAPEDIRKQVPYLELAYQLEMRASGKARQAI